MVASMSIPAAGPTLPVPLPTTDPFLAGDGFGLDELAAHWAAFAARPPMSGEAMRGADVKAQRVGIDRERLMEEAGAAVAAAARATLVSTGRRGHGTILILAGPGNNGGDGSVAAPPLPAAGLRVPFVLVPSDPHPYPADARRNWERLEGTNVDRIHAANDRDERYLLAGVQNAGLPAAGLRCTGC